METDRIETPAGLFQRQFVGDSVAGRSNQTLVCGWRIRGPLDERRIARALDALVARHEALRTSFTTSDTRCRQRIHPPATVVLHRRPLAADESPDAAVIAEADAAFDLRAGPPLRAALLQVGEDDRLAVLTMHHAVADGWSCTVLDRELRALLGGAEQLPLPPSRAQFRDVVAHERSLDGAASRDVWLERIARVGELELPRARRDADAGAGEGGFVVRAHELDVVDAATVRRLEALAVAARTTFPTLVFAAVALSLMPYARRCLRLGVVHANRVRPELRDVVGPVGDVLPVCLALPADATFRELLVAARNEWLAALSSALPFGRLHELAGNGDDWETRPITDVGVNFFPAAGDAALGPAGAAPGPALEISSVAAPLSRRRLRKRAWLEATVPISYLTALVPGGGLGAALSVDPRVLSADVVHVLGERFRRTLAIVADDPDLSARRLAARLPQLPGAAA